MFKKILAGAITAVLSLGVVALVAGPASAHHNTIWPEVTCATDGGYKITWSVENSETNKTEVIVDSSNPAVVPIDTSFAFHETKYFVQNVTEVKDYSLSLRGYWADGNVYNDSTGTLTANRFPTGCIQVTPEATPQPSVCTGPDKYSDPTYTLKNVPGVVYTVDTNVKAPGVYPATNGTTVHIEASVSDPRYKIVGTSVWDFTFTKPAETCQVIAYPVKPDINQQSCTGPGQNKLAEYFIPNTVGVLYYLKVGPTETLQTTGWHDVPANLTTFQIVAKPDVDKFYKFDGVSSVVYDFTIDPLDCRVNVTPIEPKWADAVCKGPGDVTPTQLTLVYVEHVVYQVTINGGAATPYAITQNTVVPLQQGDVVSVTATVDDDTKYQIDKNAKIPFTHTFLAPGDCKVKVTPVKPDPTNQYCDDSVQPRVLVDGTITIKPADNVEYYLDGKLTAPGTYKIDPGAHQVTIKFDSNKYYLDPDSHLFPFDFTIEPGKCLPTHGLLTPLAVSTQIGCFNAGSYTLSNSISDAAAVIWTVNGSQVAQGKYTVSGAGTVTITATPNAPDYGFNPGVQTSWTVDFAKPAVCDVETLATTGQSPTGLLIAADMLVVAGLALFAMRAVRRGRSQTA